MAVFLKGTNVTCPEGASAVCAGFTASPLMYSSHEHNTGPR